MLTRMYLYSTSTKLSIDVWLYLDRPGSLSLYCNTFVCSFRTVLLFKVVICFNDCNYIHYSY